MLQNMLVTHCSPTLAGIKSGNLFSCYMEEEELKKELRELNHLLVKRNIRLVVTRFGNHFLVYMYRPDFLEKDFSDSTAQEILSQRGYSLHSPNRCVAELCKKLGTESQFPHEIGLFLGYPSEDVKGFIDNEAKCYKCSGVWKVYGDVEEAQCRFAQYKSCTECYMNSFAKYHSIDRLAVALS